MALRFLADSLAALAQATHATQRNRGGILLGHLYAERLGMAGLLRHWLVRLQQKRGV